MGDETKISIKYGFLRNKVTTRSVLWLVPKFRDVCEERKTVRSDIFKVSNLPNSLLFISITAHENTVTIFVKRCISNAWMHKLYDYSANVVLSFEDAFKNLHLHKESSMNKYTQFVTLMYDRSSLYDMLIRGNLQVHCCVTVNEYDVKDARRHFGILQNKIWNRCSSFSINELKEHIEVLLEDDVINKVTITIDGEDFPVHKTLLCSHSPVFSAMFSHDTLENKRNHILINDIHRDVIGEMLKFIYTGCTSILSPCMNIELYIAADKYAISGLKQRCSKFLADSLNQETVLDVLVLSHQCGDNELKYIAIQFLIEKASNLLESEEFLEFIENESGIIQSILLALVKQVTK